VKQSGKITHLNFWTSDYNCQSFESKEGYAIAMICCQEYWNQENGDTSAKNEVCPVV
jgi:hypothetical protein